MSKPCISSAVILQLEEELEAEEQDMISFACQDITSETNIRELLNELNEKSMHAIVEVLWLVKRFDLLKKYLKLSRIEAEHLFKNQTKIISDYRHLLVEINGHIEEEDLKSLMFLLKNELRNTGQLKKTFLSLVTDLEKNNLISPENLDLLQQSFQTIHRVDLKNKIHKFKQKGHLENGSGCISPIVVPPPILRNPLSSPFKHAYVSNGHKDKIPVQETRPFIQAETRDDRYPVRSELLGFCLIIDCVGNDSAMLEDLFKRLNFAVKVQTYTSVQEAKNILENVAKMDHHRHDIFICILISRGNDNSLFFVDECSNGLPLEKIRKYFTGKSCPNLVGKPKLFFIQNYITNDYEMQHDGDTIEADGPSYRGAGQEIRQSVVNTPNEADIFWSNCKVSERQLQRLSGSPSLYPRTLIGLLSDEQKRKHKDIQELHIELSRILTSKQDTCPMLQHTLTKKLYIHPS